MLEVVSEEKNETGKPLLSGLLLNLAEWSEDDLEDTRVEQIKRAIRNLASKHKTYKEPYMSMDLIERNNIKLFDLEGEELIADNKNLVRVVVSAWDIVNLDHIANPGNSVVRANTAIPIYRWFQAANLLLKNANIIGRLIPFPLDQEKDEVVFHMLRTTPDEFTMYQRVLEFATTQEPLEKAFATSARYSYEILRQRGISEST